MRQWAPGRHHSAGQRRRRDDQRYHVSLDDDAGGQFAIDPSTGVVTVAGAIDREAGATRSLTIRATSDDGSTVTQSYTIAIRDLDEFDITPISDNDAAADVVDENAAVGTAVGITTLTATPTRRPTALPTRWTTMPADSSPSIRRLAWSPWPAQSTAKREPHVRSRSAPPATTGPRSRRATQSRSTTWTNSTFRRSRTLTPGRTKWRRTRLLEHPSGSRPGPGIWTVRPIRSATPGRHGWRAVRDRCRHRRRQDLGSPHYEVAGSYTITVRAREPTARTRRRCSRFRFGMSMRPRWPWASNQPDAGGSLDCGFTRTLANDFDVDGDGLTIVLVGNVLHGA